MKFKQPCREGNGRHGFTLIEIMVVVAILGLTLMMGLPAFLRTVQRQGMGKVEYELIEACKEARRQAIMSNQITKLVIHPLDGTFEVPGAYPKKQLPSDIAIAILGVNFVQLERAEEAVVNFTPKGFSDEFTIVLHSASGQYVKIYLDTVTALPQVENVN